VISRKSISLMLTAAALLISVRVALDFSVASAYVYPEYDFGQFWFAFLTFIASLVFVFAIALRRLLQKRFFDGLVLLVVLGCPFLFKKAIDEHHWKFRLHRSAYQSAIQADSTPSPKYHVFNWGNRNTHSMGGGFVAEAIVYDESDEIARAPGTWSAEWIQRRSSPPPEDLLITQILKSYPQCKRHVQSLDAHFYYVSEVC
jgi:uncharacterized membrane protein